MLGREDGLWGPNPNGGGNWVSLDGRDAQDYYDQGRAAASAMEGVEHQGSESSSFEENQRQGAQQAVAWFIETNGIYGNPFSPDGSYNQERLAEVLNSGAADAAGGRTFTSILRAATTPTGPAGSRGGETKVAHVNVGSVQFLNWDNSNSASTSQSSSSTSGKAPKKSSLNAAASTANQQFDRQGLTTREFFNEAGQGAWNGLTGAPGKGMVQMLIGAGSVWAGAVTANPYQVAGGAAMWGLGSTNYVGGLVKGPDFKGPQFLPDMDLELLAAWGEAVQRAKQNP